MFPGPGFALLIALERAERADQQPRGPRGAQAHVDFIQLAGVGLSGQQMNDPLAQPGEELRAIDGFGPIGFGHRVCVVDKH
ncbi:hypothetical protein D3C84_958470 [compost metagenome]